MRYKVPTLASADNLAQNVINKRIIFVFKSPGYGMAVYIIGKRIFAKGWK